MNILCVTAHFPFPLEDGARIRNYHLLKYLSKHHHVHLLSLVNRPPSQESIDAVSTYCASLKYIVKARGFFTKIKELLLSELSNKPYIIHANTTADLRCAIERSHKIHNIDLIQFHEIYVAANASFDSLDSFFSLDTPNIESQLLARTAETAENILSRIFYSREAKKMRVFEEQIATKSDLVFAVSPEDMKYFLQFNENSFCAPNGIDAVSSFQSDREHKIIFTGLLSYPPNRDAVLYFLRRIWPIIIKRMPELKFDVIGRNPDREMLKFESTQVRFLTNVDNISPHFEQASAMIVPLRAGGGTRLKILQAFAHGLPVVSSTLGAEGLGVQDGRHLILGDDEATFADAVVELVKMPERGKLLANNAKQHISDNYLWSDIIQICLQAYNSLIECEVPHVKRTALQGFV